MKIKKTIFALVSGVLLIGTTVLLNTGQECTVVSEDKKICESYEIKPENIVCIHRNVDGFEFDDCRPISDHEAHLASFDVRLATPGITQAAIDFILEEKVEVQTRMNAINSLR